MILTVTTVFLMICLIVITNPCLHGQYGEVMFGTIHVMEVLCCRYATEVDVDFVRKSVRAIGRCAIKVEQAAERCVSTLLDLIQTKVNYVVQEAIVVIKVRPLLSDISGYLGP